MTIRKKTGHGGADAVARNAQAGERAEIRRRGKPPVSVRFAQEDETSRARSHGPKTTEVLAAQTTKDSNFGGTPKPARPTADDVEDGIDGAANVPFESLPAETQATLTRRREIRLAFADFPHDGMFAGESDKSWGQPVQPKSEKPTL